MQDGKLLYLGRADVERVALDLETIIDLVEKAFIEKGNGKTEMPPKPAIHPGKDAFLHAMLAYIPAMRSAGIKWVGGNPNNTGKGFPYITGLMILNDADTCIPYAVMDCTWITAYRTAAATAVAAKYLARPDTRIAGILACGVQGRTNLEALARLFPLQIAYAYDTNPKAQERYAAEMSEKLGIEVIPVDDPRLAVVESDLVVTSGPILKDPTPTIRKDWLKPGAFASAMDYDSYWFHDALEQIDLFATDDMAQMDYYRSLGYFKGMRSPYADLGEIVTGRKPGRTEENQRSMAMNLGLAIDDMAVAPEIYRRAREMGIGTWLSL
jgi:ornithine cyclodeaminase/alanine dehydrogenase-like protein (mu-crystallin family)